MKCILLICLLPLLVFGRPNDEDSIGSLKNYVKELEEELKEIGETTTFATQSTTITKPIEKFENEDSMVDEEKMMKKKPMTKEDMEKDMVIEKKIDELAEKMPKIVEKMNRRERRWFYYNYYPYYSSMYSYYSPYYYGGWWG
ncbi:hypothetical protein SNEBB_000151 [Seison nebaliae]|nr:hypothetical protein SNEBB_000151 [Seison nebaliae]